MADESLSLSKSKKKKKKNVLSPRALCFEASTVAAGGYFTGRCENDYFLP